jgi:hypothetical protein
LFSILLKKDTVNIPYAVESLYTIMNGEVEWSREWMEWVGNKRESPREWMNGIYGGGRERLRSSVETNPNQKHCSLPSGHHLGVDDCGRWFQTKNGKQGNNIRRIFNFLLQSDSSWGHYLSFYFIFVYYQFFYLYVNSYTKKGYSMRHKKTWIEMTKSVSKIQKIHQPCGQPTLHLSYAHTVWVWVWNTRCSIYYNFQTQTQTRCAHW